jgi:hypothetical protein
MDIYLRIEKNVSEIGLTLFKSLPSFVVRLRCSLARSIMYIHSI